jgi:hypothetical protein
MDIPNTRIWTVVGGLAGSDRPPGRLSRRAHPLRRCMHGTKDATPLAMDRVMTTTRYYDCCCYACRSRPSVVGCAMWTYKWFLDVGVYSITVLPRPSTSRRSKKLQYRYRGTSRYTLDCLRLAVGPFLPGARAYRIGRGPTESATPAIDDTIVERGDPIECPQPPPRKSENTMTTAVFSQPCLPCARGGSFDIQPTLGNFPPPWALVARVL